MAERDFKGVWIPKEIWLDERLTALDKVILTEIDSLDRGENGCFASNEHLAKFCQCSERKVTESVAKLIGFNYVKIISFDGRKRFLRSCLAENAIQGSKNCEADSQNLLHSNTYSNPTNNSEIYLVGFDEFWKVYPKHEAKQDAMKAWKSIKPDEALLNTILADIKKRLADGGAWYKKERQYVPLPATYLRGARWEDEPSGGTTDEVKNPDEPWWKSKPWWEWPIEEQRKLEQQVEERERAERERNGG